MNAADGLPEAKAVDLAVRQVSSLAHLGRDRTSKYDDPPTDVRWVSECMRCSYRGGGCPDGFRCISCDWWLLWRGTRCLAPTGAGMRCKRSCGPGEFLCQHHHHTSLYDLEEAMGKEAAALIRFKREQAMADAIDAYRTDQVEIMDALAQQEDRVYFLACEGYVKVGMSSRVEVRIANLRRPGDSTRKPVGIDVANAELLGTIPGGHRTESFIHAQLHEHHAAGEWFHLNAEVRAYIDARLAGEPSRLQPAAPATEAGAA